jgi:hypothetical protein
MPEVQPSCSHRVGASRKRAPLLLAALGILALGPAGAATAATALKPSVPPGFKIAKLASPPPGAGNCDDLAFLEGHLFMACQDTTLSTGGGGDSTLAEYGLDGTLVRTWSIKDKIDGMNGDPLNRRVIVSLNEDANSHLATITPSTGQVTYYTYSPDPRGANTPTAVRTGGGTDQVSVDSTGHVLITASHAGTKTGTAVFKVVLTPPSSPTGTGTATLSPTFPDDAPAANGNTGSGTVQLALGDVDSGAIVPQSSPRYGGSYVITDQTALVLVFAHNINTGTGLTVLKTPFGLDDLLWTTSPGGTLYIVDKGPTAILPNVSASALYKVTGPFTTNTVLASNDGVGEQVVTVNLNTGALTPFVQHLQTTKGLVYLNADGTQTQLPLNGSTFAAASKSSESDSTLTIVLIIVGVAILGGVGYLLVRRRPGTS